MLEPHVEHADWFVDTVERLFGEFWAHHPLTHIVAVTRQCRAEIAGSGSPVAAMPELVERLARQRLAGHESELTRQASPQQRT